MSCSLKALSSASNNSCQYGSWSPLPAAHTGSNVLAMLL